MTRHRALVALPLMLALAVAAAGQEEEGDYLEGFTRGPYRGLVVDAATGQPLEGAVVVAAWERVRVYPGQWATVPYAAREVLTGRDGRFILDAREVEERAPRRTRPPRFTIFLPGYAAYPTSAFSHSGGFTRGKTFENAGMVVGLPRLETLELRRKHVRELSDVDFYVPLGDIPILVRLLNVERAALGLAPYAPPEKPQ